MTVERPGAKAPGLCVSSDEFALITPSKYVMDMQRTQAAVFVDLCGYTELTERLGDAAAARISTMLRAIANDVARRNGGRVVKMLGDGAHLHFARPADAVPAACELVERVLAAGLPCARVGVNAGPMVEVDGDYYGLAVNIAARIASLAHPGEVLVGEPAVARTATVAFEGIGARSLRGVTVPVALYRATGDRTIAA